MDTKILEQMEEIFGEEIALVQHDLAAMEALVKEKLQLLGQGFLQRLLDRQPNGYKGSSVACKCGNSMKFVQHRTRDIHTVFGWIKVKRAYYHCSECGTGLAPYDESSGLGCQQLSPALAKACCLLAVDDSFELASRKIEQLFGQRVCDDTVKQVVHQVGSVVLQKQAQELDSFSKNKKIPQAQVKPERLYVSPDGTGVRENDGWHEAKAACIYWENQRLKRVKRYVARFDNSEKFGQYMWLEACKCGFREAKEVVYIGDGAKWIHNQQRKHFKKATFIIDWYHASEHVWDCGKVLFSEGTEATEKWVRERLALLWDGWTKRLLDDLKEQRKKCRGAKREAVEKLIRYISSNEEHMRYDVFREAGYDIGSGAVEGACKNVIGKRLKQSGMTWSRPGSSATLALRVSLLNGEWERLWAGKPLAA